MKIGKSALVYLSMFALTSFKYFFGLKHTRWNKQEEKGGSYKSTTKGPQRKYAKKDIEISKKKNRI